MMMLMIWMVMAFVGVATSAVGENHNEAAHNALCDLMKAAVGKWEKRREGLSDTLKKALGRTLFGDESGGDITELRKQLPSFYDEVLDGSATRSTACGGRESGQSAPYDTVCLCTVGDGGWPLNENSIKKLCGKTLSDLGCEKNQGWHGQGSGKPQIEATWKNVTSECLHEDKEKGEKLKDALNEFIDNLNQARITGYNNIYRLGEGDFKNKAPCDGSPNNGLCVMYYNSTKITKIMPWWVDLQNALPEEEKFQEEKKKREEEERHKKQEEEQNLELPQTAALTSAPPTTNQTDQHSENHLSAQFSRLNMTSGTPISPPCIWFPSAAFLI